MAWKDLAEDIAEELSVVVFGQDRGFRYLRGPEARKPYLRTKLTTVERLAAFKAAGDRGRDVRSLERERRIKLVLTLAKAGCTRDEIARRVGIRPETVSRLNAAGGGPRLPNPRRLGHVRG